MYLGKVSQSALEPRDGSDRQTENRKVKTDRHGKEGSLQKESAQGSVRLDGALKQQLGDGKMHGDGQGSGPKALSSALTEVQASC